MSECNGFVFFGFIWKNKSWTKNENVWREKNHHKVQSTWTLWFFSLPSVLRQSLCCQHQARGRTIQTLACIRRFCQTLTSRKDFFRPRCSRALSFLQVVPLLSGSSLFWLWLSSRFWRSSFRYQWRSWISRGRHIRSTSTRNSSIKFHSVTSATPSKGNLLWMACRVAGTVTKTKNDLTNLL